MQYKFCLRTSLLYETDRSLGEVRRKRSPPWSVILRTLMRKHIHFQSRAIQTSKLRRDYWRIASWLTFQASCSALVRVFAPMSPWEESKR